MKILMVGKTGVFDTLAVALGYLNQTDIACYSYFGDLATEKARRILEVGEEQGHKVFIVNHKNPRIIMEINHELATLSGLGEQESLQVIPLSIAGENLSWLLIKLASLPLLGKLFLNWAKSRTQNRLPFLLKLGQDLYRNHAVNSREREEMIAAAKPIHK